MTVAFQPCPICRAELRVNTRYPDHLCGDCARLAADADGRPVKFSNASPGHPNLIETLTATYDDGSAYMSQQCFVRGVRCWADEARFGGIVVRPSPDGQRPRDGEKAA